MWLRIHHTSIHKLKIYNIVLRIYQNFTNPHQNTKYVLKIICQIIPQNFFLYLDSLPVSVLADQVFHKGAAGKVFKGASVQLSIFAY